MATLMEQLFGWTLKKPKEQEPESFTPEINDDGAALVQSMGNGAYGGAMASYVDLGHTATTEAELVSKYREIAQHPEVDAAIEDVVDEAIVTTEDYIVRLITDKVDLSDKVKNKIETEFDELLHLLDFNDNAYEVFKRWYVDGRLYYHAIIDEKNPSKGIQELRYIDPRKIRKVREVQSVQKNGYTLQKTKDEYFVYNERGFAKNVGGTFEPTNANASGLKITADAILHCTSGVMDQNNQLVLSHLHKAIKPLNQLRTLEDAVVIYRISRAPERRIFYIDVGNLPKAKAEQYLRDTMIRHKNKLVYDAGTGEVRDDRKFMTMMEDYWFARRDGGRGTEVTTLQGGQNLGELADVEYFQKKLYRSLGVPTSRLDPELGMALGRASEISRDEIKFNKFVQRCRARFNQLFLRALEKQLVLKKIILPEEWSIISRNLIFDYRQDNHFTELKNLELLNGRLQALQMAEPMIGTALSWKWARRNILMQDDEIQAQIDAEIAEEATQEQFKPREQKMMEAQAQIEAALAPQEPEEEEDDPNLGHPVEDEDDPAAMGRDENEDNLGYPTVPPPGKKNGPDEPVKPAGTKGTKKPAAKK